MTIPPGKCCFIVADDMADGIKDGGPANVLLTVVTVGVGVDDHKGKKSINPAAAAAAAAAFIPVGVVAVVEDVVVVVVDAAAELVGLAIG